MSNNKRPIELGYDLSKSVSNIQIKIKPLKEKVATVLKEEKNICFEDRRIRFPEMIFGNIDEALKYLREQENLLLQKNRENNSEAVKEITELLVDICKGYLNPENYGTVSPDSDPMQYSQNEVQELKNILHNHNGNWSKFIYEAAVERQKKLLSGERKAETKDFFGRNNIQQEVFKKIEGEELIRYFKEEAKNIEKLPISTFENIGQFATACLLFTVLKETFQNYKE